ncbi:MAG: DNA alkylation repair protein [Saprospiraceae bacterium]|nr:DNA alkylation repair protein [Saprospiraceae bacterium]
MIKDKFKEIRKFCETHSDPDTVKKYSRYFKEGYDGYGIKKEDFESVRDQWIDDWSDEMTLDDYLDLGDLLMQKGKLEEKSFAISFIKSERENYTESTFDRIGIWFEMGISDWATTDVLCMLVLSSFIIDEVISFEKLKSWTLSDDEWQRRAVPVTLNELVKGGLDPTIAFPLLDPIMLDQSEYVQKGIGTLLRGLWKKHPKIVEGYLLKWKDQCGRLIVRYATEKMNKEDRKRFRKKK